MQPRMLPHTLMASLSGTHIMPGPEIHQPVQVLHGICCLRRAFQSAPKPAAR